MRKSAPITTNMVLLLNNLVLTPMHSKMLGTALVVQVDLEASEAFKISQPRLVREVLVVRPTYLSTCLVLLEEEEGLLVDFRKICREATWKPVSAFPSWKPARAPHVRLMSLQ